MKLPSINYKQREALAKVDPMSYLRIGNAKAQGLKAVGKLVGDAGEAYYQQESVTQMQSSLLNYNESLDELQQNLKPYTANEGTGKNEGVWLNGQDDFAKQERDIRQVALDNATTPLAKKLINERADRNLNQRKRTNTSQLLGFKKEHDVAALQTSIDRYAKAKNYDAAMEAVAQAALVGTVGDSVAQTQIEKLMYEKINFEYATEVEDIVSEKDLIDYRERVNSSFLKNTDKTKNIAGAESVILNKNRKSMDDVIQAVASDKEGTPLKAYAAGEAELDRLKRKSAEQLGGDEDFKKDVYFAAKEVLARYYETEVKGSQVLNDRFKNERDYATGKSVATSKFNEIALSDNFLRNKFRYTPKGKKDYTLNFNNKDPSLNAVSDEEFLTNRLGYADLYVSYVEKQGNQVPLLENKINAALTSNNGELANGAAAISYKIGQTKPSALYAMGKKNNMSIINTQMELLGKGFDGIDEAIKTLKQYNAVSPEEKIIRIGNAGDNNKFFEDNFDAIFEKVYPDPKSVPYWFDVTPATKRKYMNAVQRSMETQLVINNGDQAKALQAAIITSKEKWSTSTVNGVSELMEFAPEDVMPNEVPNNTDIWRREQVISDFKAQGSTLNINYDTLKVEAVQRFDKNNPAWKATAEVDGMIVSLGLVTFDEAKSPVAIEQKQEIADQKAANLRTEERNKKRVEWDKENPVGSRRINVRSGVRVRTSVKTNPYGSDPSKQNPVGKFISGYGKGSKAIAEAAQEGMKIIEAGKAKRKAERLKNRPKRNKRGTR
jgi:hypothetical protein